MVTSDELQELIKIVKAADEAILKVYAEVEIAVETKLDNSPVTKADKAADAIISQGLARLFPDIPAISEEGDQLASKGIVSQDLFWLVDPLDGTKDFIARTGQFVVCLGLIQNGKPVFGIASVPAQDTVYYGGPANGSFKITGANQPVAIKVAAGTNVVLGNKTPNELTEQYIKQNYADHEYRVVGSQLKFLMIAEGLADAYPRLGTGMHLWDIAAGHAILEGAGGVLERPDGSPIDYQRPDLLAGDFVARAN